MFDKVLELLKETLNGDFTRDAEKQRKRKIIFWYDPKKEYEEFVNELSLDNTEIIKFDDNSFWIRYHIEIEEQNKNIIIYFPSERKKDADNDLLDLETANSDLFFNPDSTTMRLKDLGLREDCRKVISKYAKFFGDKKREQNFKNFDINQKTPDNIDLIITAVLLNIKSINEDDILKEIIRDYFSDEKRYEDLFKFGNEEFILGLFNDNFNTKVESYKELPDIYKSLIFTYFAISINDIKKVNRYSKYLLIQKSTSVYVFINNLMRDKTTREYFEELSKQVEEEFGIKDLLDSLDIEDYKLADAFECIDKFIIKYLVDKLENNIGEFELYNELISNREKKYWYDKFENEYDFLKIAILFFKRIKMIEGNIKTVDFDNFAKDYTDILCEVDTLYRKAYFYYDNIDDKDQFMSLKNTIENIYVNNFMSELSIKWSDMIKNLKRYDSNSTMLQKDFYKNYVSPFNNKKNKIIVIISDAFRYECAKELNDRLKTFATKSEITYMQGLVPSYTKLGMASLLPNNKLSRVNDSDDILVDGFKSSSIKDRELILQQVDPDSIAIWFDDLYEKTKLEWKKMFSGKKIVYIYHNTIDNAGEHNENTIFTACNNAINELEKLIKDLHTTFSGINAFITADHGFFYKRGKVESYEKTTKTPNAIKQKTRYSYSDNPLDEEGILSINLDYVFGENSGYVNIPQGNIIFAKQGTGINYVHGGILPEEIIIPVINFKSSRISDENKKVGITYSGLSTKITNIITYLEFLQDNNIDDNNKPCRYLLHFEDENGMKISDECTIVANYENTDVKDRFFKEKFVFKNIIYDKNKSYYLVIIDEETGIEYSRTKFYIDIAIINNFDFN